MATQKEWKVYFDMCEADILDNPTHAKYQKVFFRLGKHDHVKDVLYFPVEIRSGRVSFGKVQFLITPGAGIKGVLGERWVDRKSLIMGHDRLFSQLEKEAIPPTEGEEP